MADFSVVSVSPVILKIALLSAQTPSSTAFPHEKTRPWAQVSRSPAEKSACGSVHPSSSSTRQSQGEAKCMFMEENQHQWHSSLLWTRAANGLPYLLAEAAGDHHLHFHPFPPPIRPICSKVEESNICSLVHKVTLVAWWNKAVHGDLSGVERRKEDQTAVDQI